ncbi:MAG: type II and III secretion system protein [bacterium]
MLQSEGKADILSAPNIISLDGEKGKGEASKDEFHVLTSDITASNYPYQRFEIVKAVISCEVTPQTLGDGRIRITIDAKAEFINTKDNMPIVTSRHIVNTVTVKNRETIYIGGLLSSIESEVKYQVPVLGKIPILKYAFSREEKKVEKRNLFVFITPTILED